MFVGPSGSTGMFAPIAVRRTPGCCRSCLWLCRRPDRLAGFASCGCRSGHCGTLRSASLRKPSRCSARAVRGGQHPAAGHRRSLPFFLPQARTLLPFPSGSSAPVIHSSPARDRFQRRKTDSSIGVAYWTFSDGSCSRNVRSVPRATAVSARARTVSGFRERVTRPTRTRRSG